MLPRLFSCRAHWRSPGLWSPTTASIDCAVSMSCLPSTGPTWCFETPKEKLPSAPANMSNFSYFEVTSDMLSNSNGCFLKQELRIGRGVTEAFNHQANFVVWNFGVLEVSKVALLADSGSSSSGGGSSLTIDANRVAVSNNSGAIVASNITTTELDFLDNVSSNIQNQIDNLSSPTITASQ